MGPEIIVRTNSQAIERRIEVAEILFCASIFHNLTLSLAHAEMNYYCFLRNIPNSQVFFIQI